VSAMRAHHFTIATAAVLLLAATVQAQSLADLARKEEERRKNIAEAAKLYTNKDLNAASSSSMPPVAAIPAKPPADAAKDAGKGKDKDQEAKDGEKKEKDANGKEIVKDKAYWAGRLKALQDQLDQNQTYAEAVQTRINALTTDFVNRADPAQRAVIERDRQKALAELARLKQAILDGKKAVGTLEEEARRAGVPPGWLR
jgi:hypothetical protein